MKKTVLFGIFGYLTFAVLSILYFDGLVYTETFEAVAITTGDARCIVVSSETPSSIPEAGRRFHVTRNITFCNNSSSDTVRVRPADSNGVALHGSPLLRNCSWVSVDVSPLKPYLTFYALAPAGSTGAEVCYQTLGQDVLISTGGIGGQRAGFQ